MIPLIVHELLCLYLVYSVFVRAVPMTCDTRPAVRLAKAQSELAVMAAQIAALRKYRQKK